MKGATPFTPLPHFQKSGSVFTKSPTSGSCKEGVSRLWSEKVSTGGTQERRFKAG